MDELIIGGRKFTSRLFLGTGKFASAAQMRAAIVASGAELVTVALRRVGLAPGGRDEDLVSFIPEGVQVMLNTSGARNSDEALRLAAIARAAGCEWIKLEIHPDPNYLLPDPVETLKAATELVRRGFTVLPYINADPVLAKRLEEVGVAAVMPLGSLIGSGQGLRTEAMLRIIVAESNVPMIVDAGLGLPSHAAAAIELGADAVLVNSAIAAAGDPVKMARGFSLAVDGALRALEAQPAAPREFAAATSPSGQFDGVI